jgi:Uma2 family endonuclease
MSQVLAAPPLEFEEIVRNLVTEDDEPVGHMYSGDQQRLLVEPLYSSWTPPPGEENPDEPRPFLANANVGIFYGVRQPPLVPDMFLSLDAQVGPEWEHSGEPRSYFVWEFGKAPEVAVEIVSNKVGRELSRKLRGYARIGVDYYVVYDPWLMLGQTELYVYELSVTPFGRRYILREDFQLPGVSLSLTLWEGFFEGARTRWLRWRDADGALIPAGKERAEQEAARADKEAARANQETVRANEEAARANKEAARAERLAARLREMGVAPEDL